MTQAGVTPVDAFASVVQQAQGGQCMDNSYNAFISQLRNTTADPSWEGFGLRQWTWQTCST
jgi:hypothetical protein